MPSRRTIALILFFWLLTTGYVAYRDVWPRLFASGPPPVTIDLVDEAAQTIPIRWTIYRGDKVVGRLSSHISYKADDDTFLFTSEYKKLELDAGLAVCTIPEATTVDRVTRGGDLREQTLEGTLEVSSFGVKLGSANAKIHGNVIDGQLIAECDITSSLGNFKQKLDPVPVPEGQPLNPLLPVNRLTNVRPGRHGWHVEMKSPLKDAMDAIKKKLQGKESGAAEKRETLFAQVLPDQQELNWFGQSVPCWIIEYRQAEPVARTWVRVSDGKVMMQEAFLSGEHMTILRDK
jgi:hypothetical protein